MTAMDNLLGCNTLYPGGRLTDVRSQFGLKAQKEALHIIRDAGFDGCEFSHYECLSTAECGKLRAECDKIGLQPWSAHSWVILPEDQKEAEEKLPLQRKSLDGAAALGVKVMVVHAASGRYDLTQPTQRHLRTAGLETSLVALAPYTIALDLDIAIENCAGRAELEFLVATLKTLTLFHVGFNIDTGHAALSGMTPAEAIGLMGSRICTTHLQDNFGKQDDHLPPGCGSIDWAATMAALQSANYKKMLMVEISDCPPGREPNAVEDTRKACENLRRLTGQA
jgi:sugar phosphate isomerase/epimerase